MHCQHIHAERYPHKPSARPPRRRSDPGYTGFFDPADNKYGRCTFGHNTIALDADDAYLANPALPLVGHDQVRRDGARITAYQSSPGFDYVTGSAAAAYSPPASGANTCIHFWREGEPSGFATIRGPQPTGTGWSAYEFSGEVPEGAATFCLALQFGGADGSVWYDDAEVRVDGHDLEPVRAVSAVAR